MENYKIKIVYLWIIINYFKNKINAINTINTINKIK
jgi:hypothetical protein